MSEEEPKVEVQNNTNNGGENRGKSITAMILGIVSVVFCCVWYISIPCGIVGLVLGILGKKSEDAKGMALTGIILSSIAIGLAVLVILGIATIIGIGTAAALS